jgi:hypothetical protein
MGSINVATLRRLLKRVHLGGLIEECILKEGKNGINSIQAIDLTNSLILSVTGKTNFTDFGELGLSDLGTVCKYLESADEDTELKVSENRIIFKNNSGTFKYLLSQPDLIPTTLDDKDALNNLVDACTHEVTLQEEFQKNFSQSITLTKTNSVSIVVDEKNVRLTGGLESEHQFTLKIGQGKAIKESKKETRKFTVPIFGSHLGAVLGVLDWSVRENLPTLMIREGRPIIIKQQKDVWALTVVDEK